MHFDLKYGKGCITVGRTATSSRLCCVRSLGYHCGAEEFRRWISTLQRDLVFWGFTSAEDLQFFDLSVTTFSLLPTWHS